MTRRRLDSELVRRGLATSRTEAQEAVLAGLVRVRGTVATKSSTLVADDEPLDLARAARRYVSRGGEKLGAALERFGIDPTGLDCLDVGASTGGFTDRLLQGGAHHVVAVDVGYGQLAWALRGDERVTVLERTNARDLSVDALPYRPALVVVDVSFISLHAVMPALASVAAVGADAVFLIKPQFEAGRGEVGRGGVVRDPEVWSRVISSVIGAASEAGFAPQGVVPSPVRGPAGNVEFLLWSRRDAPPRELDVAAAVAEGTEVAA
ncbi:MAG TPA: TlyA family RNA methyltransferase [Actinomycetota bacterium]|nr:TlyA family RNA methyltransferase [Actinomycetota bacterium]